jgi:hypothetical protein
MDLELLNPLVESQTQPAAANDLNYVKRDSEIEDAGPVSLDAAFELLALDPAGLVGV